jgi:redox-sensitive bicupin YhaK (pirin superfamily)
VLRIDADPRRRYSFGMSFNLEAILARRRFLAGAAGLLITSCSRPAPHATPSVQVAETRAVRRLLPGLPTQDGAGVSLLRVIGQRTLRDLDPFLLLDRFHSDDPSAYIRGFPDHPHRGFETVTVMLAGHMLHRDSKGNAGNIRDGGAQWMTAGRGIIHSEMPQQVGGLMSGFQLWINLPAREKMQAPAYQDLQRDRIPAVGLGGGNVANVIVGRAFDTAGPVSAPSTEPLVTTLTLEDDTPVEIPTPRSHTAWLFVHAGEVLLGETRVPAGTLAILGEGERVRFRADAQRAGVLFAAARPLNEPIARRGPFVMNTEAEIERAFADYRNGTLTL